MRPVESLVYAKNSTYYLNLLKTQDMLFSTKRDKAHSPTLELNSVQIDFCDNVKYLRVLFDNKF